jgi:hypothetical protein
MSYALAANQEGLIECLFLLVLLGVEWASNIRFPLSPVMA